MDTQENKSEQAAPEAGAPPKFGVARPTTGPKTFRTGVLKTQMMKRGPGTAPGTQPAAAQDAAEPAAPAPQAASAAAGPAPAAAPLAAPAAAPRSMLLFAALLVATLVSVLGVLILFVKLQNQRSMPGLQANFSSMAGGANSLVSLGAEDGQQLASEARQAVDEAAVKADTAKSVGDEVKAFIEKP